MALHAEDIDGILAEGCGNPKCRAVHDHLILNGRCHPKAGTIAVIRKGDDHVYIACAKCEKPIVAFQVASKSSSMAE